MIAILIFPAIVLREDLGWLRVVIIDFPLFVGATGVISRYYIHSQREIYSDWKSRILYLPFVLALGMGISLNNARGVIQALRGHETAFNRTPKYRVIGRNGNWYRKNYALRKNMTSFLEIGLGFYLLGAIGVFDCERAVFPRAIPDFVCRWFFLCGGNVFIPGHLGENTFANN